MQKIKLSVTVPLKLLQPAIELFSAEGCNVEHIQIINGIHRRTGHSVPHRAYGKPAIELVYEFFRTTQGPHKAIDIAKALNMPEGTAGGTLSALKAKKKVKMDPTRPGYWRLA
jgi:hypothetical protein